MSSEMYLGLPLFPGVSQHNQLSRYIEMLGIPSDTLIEQSKNGAKYFTATGISRQVNGKGRCDFGKFRLKTAEEYALETNSTVPVLRKYLKYNRLDEIVMKCPVATRTCLTEDQKAVEFKSREKFLDLLRGLLQLNPWERWTAKQAVGHPFFTNATYMGPYIPPADLKTSDRKLAYSIHMHKKQQQHKQQLSKLTAGSPLIRTEIMQHFDPRDSHFKPLQFRRLTEPYRIHDSAVNEHSEKKGNQSYTLAHGQTQGTAQPQTLSSLQSEVQSNAISQLLTQSSISTSNPHFGYMKVASCSTPPQMYHVYHQVPAQVPNSSGAIHTNIISSQQTYTSSPYGSPYYTGKVMPTGLMAQTVLVDSPGEGRTAMVPLHQQQQQESGAYSFTSAVPIKQGAHIVPMSGGTYMEVPTAGTFGGQGLLSSSLGNRSSHVVISDFGQALQRPELNEQHLFESEHSVSYQQRQMMPLIIQQHQHHDYHHNQQQQQQQQQQYQQHLQHQCHQQVHNYHQQCQPQFHPNQHQLLQQQVHEHTRLIIVF